MHIRTDFQEPLELSRQFVALPDGIRLLGTGGREILFKVILIDEAELEILDTQRAVDRFISKRK